MRVRARQFWDRLRSSYWFVPTGMSLAAVGASYATVALDAGLPPEALTRIGWAYRGGPDGAAGVLQVVAGSMVSLAGLVFSLTLVALSLASNQFGPRLLRNFMRDPVTQVVMGTFLAAFLYCLFVLRTIRRTEGEEFVPNVSVRVGVVLAVLGLVALIYFIHHLSRSIQADTLVGRLAADLRDAVDRLYPVGIGGAAGGPADPALPAGEPAVVTAAEDGYIQVVDGDALLAAAGRHDVVVELVRRPGQYVMPGAALARVWPAGRRTDELAAAVGEAILLGDERTPTQDVEFVVGQLVEIAVRALSGPSDPFTAVACVDRLGSGLARLARRPPPAAARTDAAGVVRVIAHPARFPAVMDAAFNPIRQYAAADAVVSIRLLEVLADLAAAPAAPADRAAVLAHAERVARAVLSHLTEPSDQADVTERLDAVRRAAGSPAQETPS